MPGLYALGRGDMQIAPNGNADYGGRYPYSDAPAQSLDEVRRPTPGMLGSGGAARAGNTVALRNMYRMYVEEQASAGNTPLSFEEWISENYDAQKRGTLYAE